MRSAALFSAGRLVVLLFPVDECRPAGGGPSREIFKSGVETNLSSNSRNVWKWLQAYVTPTILAGLP